MSSGPDPFAIVDGVPPIDDGAAHGLVGRSFPDVELDTTAGKRRASELLGARAIVYIYPATGVPGRDPVPGWDEIPGAVGCTVQSLGFRDHAVELAGRGWSVLGISTQPLGEQREFASRVGLPFPLASDVELVLRDRLGLPIFEAAGRVFYRRLAILVEASTVTWVDYPVFPPQASVERVLAELAARS
jgi:peroxiredoxin